MNRKLDVLSRQTLGDVDMVTLMTFPASRAHFMEF